MNAQNGTSQKERAQLSSAEDFFNVDEMDFPTLLKLAVDYSNLIQFFNENNQSEGDWSTYFSTDETLVMANILTINPEYFRDEFDSSLDNAIAAQSFTQQQPPLESLPIFKLYRLGKLLEDWAAMLMTYGSEVGNELGKLITDLHSKLGQMTRDMPGLQDAYTEIDNSFLNSNAPINAADLSARLKKNGEIGILRQQLKSQFHSLNKAVEMTQRAAALHFPLSLKTKKHDPGVGLLIAFLRLYQDAQKKINQFTQRHLDFYYDQVLMMKPRGFKRDRTFLVFQPSIPGSIVPILKQTEFLATFDKRQPDIIFSNDEELLVSDAEVVSLYTLFFERNVANSPENRLNEIIDGVNFQYPTGGWVNTLPVVRAEDAIEITKLESFPLFGAPRDGTFATKGDSARIGFAIASNILFLSEGRRKITVALTLGVANDRVQQANTNEIDTLASRLDKLPDLLNTVSSDVEYKILRSMFTIAFTGSDKWLPVDEYSATLDRENNQIVLSIILESEYKAINAYSSKIHGEKYLTDCPVMRLELSNSGYLYPYGLLRGLRLLDVTVDVQVWGHRNVVLYNNIGQLSAITPFYPFGPRPELGSYLIVSSKETACKNLTDFELNIDWGGLPRGLGGFKTYYKGYSEAVNFDDLSAAVTTLSGGKWHPSNPSSISLLSNANSNYLDSTIPQKEVLSFRQAVDYASIVPEVNSEQDLIYSTTSKAGFFKLTLSAPKFVFGHQSYQQDLADALANNSAPKSLIPAFISGHRSRELPNPPYAPLINAVSINYKATAKISLNSGVMTGKRTREKIIHLHPKGWECLDTISDGSAMVVPQIYSSGNLVIGMRALKLSGKLTIFFQLREDALPLVADENAKLNWFYLSNDTWKILPPNRVVSDSTHGFLKQGIVTILVPDDISDDNTILPSGLFWIRVASDTFLDRFCSLYSVHTQAVQVHRQHLDIQAANTPAFFPAGTITKTKKMIPGLGKISQIVSSYGGRLPEDRAQMRIRTAERLKHKRRAITADDYERLILEEFPDIARVKCFPNLSMSREPTGRPCPGNVLIIALPLVVSRGHLQLLPTLDAYLINQVRAFITKLASPALTIEVTNPVYQHIQVRCQIKLKKGSDQGRCINLLDAAISDFISPWSTLGSTNHFGWRLCQHELESYILQQDFVERVSQFSMLSIIGSEKLKFSLSDTAVDFNDRKSEVDIVPKYPWSIAVPLKRHAIEPVDTSSFKPGVRVGIGKLEIGNTFIISPGLNNA